MRRLLFTILVTILAAAPVALSLAIGPASACMPPVTMDQVDRAMASSGAAGSRLTNLRSLRGQMAEALSRHDVRVAASIEAEAMKLMGHELVQSGPPSRGCSGATWVRKNG